VLNLQFILCTLHTTSSPQQTHKTEHLLQLPTCLYASVMCCLLPVKPSSFWTYPWRAGCSGMYSLLDDMLSGLERQVCRLLQKVPHPGLSQPVFKHCQHREKKKKKKPQQKTMKTNSCEDQFPSAMSHPSLLNLEKLRARRDLLDNCIQPLLLQAAKLCAIFKTG